VAAVVVAEVVTDETVGPGLFVVNDTLVDVAVLPTASVATANAICELLEVAVLSHNIE
jgi:hypothetical protein